MHIYVALPPYHPPAMDAPVSSTQRTRPRPRWAADLALFVLAVIVVAIPAWQALSANDMDPTALLRVGRYAASRSFVEQDLPDPVLTEDYGHDGQQFYVLSGTFPDLESAQGHVDKLRYRARRVLLPAIVSPVPRGEPLIWSMLAVNLAAVGAAAVGVGRLARRLGTTPWVGMVVAITPAMVESVEGSLGDALAFALAIWGVVVWRRRPWVAALLFLLAALSRETTLVVPLACLIVAPRSLRVPMATPVAAFLGWVVLVTVWLPPTEGAASSNLVGDALTQFTAPFRAWIEVGLGSQAVLLGAFLLVVSLACAWLLRARLPELSLWLVADAVLLVVSNEGVVGRAQNFARVAPLALAALALVVGARLLPREPQPEPLVPAPAT